MSLCTIVAIVVTWIMLWDIAMAIRENTEKNKEN